jgi:hypothetical protein
MWRAALILGVLTGCAQEPAAQLQTNAAPMARACKRISAGQIGQLPLQVDVGGQLVELSEWTMVDEAAAEIVGFAVSAPAGVEFEVQAGARTFHGNQGRWLHPEGFSGKRVQGIDAVTFCSSSVKPAVVAVR